MKYHYKTPEEIQRVREARQDSGRRFLTRTNVITLLDIAVIVLIVGALYYTGNMPGRSSYTADATTRNGRAFTATLTREDARTFRFYLNVKNENTEPITFPSGQFVSARAVLAVQGSEEVYSTKMEIDERSIAPGETAIFRGELVLPLEAGDRRFDPLIQLQWKDDEIELSL